MLHSSYIPSPEERHAITSAVHDIDSAIDTLRLQVLQLNEKLKELEEARITRLSTASALRLLPPEILGTIFMLVGDNSKLRWPLPRMELGSRFMPLRMPWIMSEICSYWRSVVVDLPHLWTRIKLDRTFVSNRDTKWQANIKEYLRLVVHRSHRKPLKIEFVTSKSASEIYMHQVMPLLLTHSERWADLSCAYLDLVAGTRNMAETPRFLSLRKVDVDGDKTNQVETGVDMPNGLFSAFKDAPCLREITIRNTINPLRTISVPWNHITHFSSRYNTYEAEEFSNILREMPVLASLRTERDTIVESMMAKRIFLPHLTFLSIKNDQAGIIWTSACIVAPSLHTLDIYAVTSFTSAHLLTMFNKSNCSIKRLTFRTSLDRKSTTRGSYDLALKNILEHMPALQHLELRAFNAVEKIVPSLVCRQDVVGQTNTPPNLHGLVPNLQTFKLEDRISESVKGLVDTLSSRINKINNLEGSQSVEKEEGYRVGLRSIHLQLHPRRDCDTTQLDLLRLKDEADSNGVDFLMKMFEPSL